MEELITNLDTNGYYIDDFLYPPDSIHCLFFSVCRLQFKLFLLLLFRKSYRRQVFYYGKFNKTVYVLPIPFEISSLFYKAF